MNARERTDLETLLGEFSRSLEQANRELLEELQGELRDLRARIAALEGQVGVARAESAALAQRVAELTETASGAPFVPAQTDPAVDRATEEIRERHQEVWDRLLAGDDPEEIARRTNRPLGEIQLIVRLLQPRNPAPGRQGR
ncbi:MAG: hypothetical protein M0Z66_06175 [Thermaerobacter sp.]|nr:hypothetical protein [Thermaerobacter sp.]